MKILRGAPVALAPDPPSVVYVAVPTPELARVVPAGTPLRCAKVAEIGRGPLGMDVQRWWAAKRRNAVCCQCREAYSMTAGCSK